MTATIHHSVHPIARAARIHTCTNRMGNRALPSSATVGSADLSAQRPLGTQRPGRAETIPPILWARAWRAHCRAIGYRSTAETHLQSTGCDARCAAASPTRARIDSAWLRTERTEPSSPTRQPHRHAWVPQWVGHCKQARVGRRVSHRPDGCACKTAALQCGQLERA